MFRHFSQRSRDVLVLLALASAPALVGAVTPPRGQIDTRSVTPQWNKHVINSSVAFEAAGVADINGDRRPDVFSGDSWYEAPNWIRHKIRDVAVSPNPNYLEDFANLPLDVNGDGRTDFVTCAYFSKMIGWVEQPEDPIKPWQTHTIDFPGPSETAQLVDLNADGLMDLLPNTVNTVVWYELQRSTNAVTWAKHDLGAEGAGHGVGVGDINLDGRIDLITPKGWFEQPKESAGKWVLHAEFQLGAAGILIHGFDVDGDSLTDVVWGMGHDFGLFWLRQSKDASGRRVWVRNTIDTTFSQVHTLVRADLDANGEMELVTGKRVYAHEVEPGATDAPIVVRYAFNRAKSTWNKVTLQLGTAAQNAPASAKDRRALKDFPSGSVGTGLQLSVHDMDGDGDLDLICPGKSGLYLLENPCVK